MRRVALVFVLVAIAGCTASGGSPTASPTAGATTAALATTLAASPVSVPTPTDVPTPTPAPTTLTPKPTPTATSSQTPEKPITVSGDPKTGASHTFQLTGGSYVVEWNADEDVVDCEIFALVLATEVNGDAVENVDAPLLRTKGNIGNEIWTDVPGGTYLLYEDRTGTALCKGPWSATLVPGEVSTRTDQPDPTPTPVSYATLTSRNWALLVKAPDNYKGDNYKIWGCITQFDAATGDNSFRAQASYHVESYWYTNGANSVFSGDATALADYVQNDVVQMDVVVLGSITYDTSIGGKMTVPSFEVDDIKRVGAC